MLTMQRSTVHCTAAQCNASQGIAIQHSSLLESSVPLCDHDCLWISVSGHPVPRDWFIGLAVRETVIGQDRYLCASTMTMTVSGVVSLDTGSPVGSPPLIIQIGSLVWQGGQL